MLTNNTLIKFRIISKFDSIRINGKYMQKKYSKAGLTVIWEASKCIHSTICITSLPKVFDMTSRPWIQLDKASIEEICNAIDNCPSGALRYYSS